MTREQTFDKLYRMKLHGMAKALEENLKQPDMAGLSPDGKRIVLAGRKDGGESVRLWTMPIAGGEPVRLPTKPDLDSFQPRWSPDGRWIAFDSERDVPGDRKLDENILVVSSDGGAP